MERINKQKQWLLEKYVSYFFIYSFAGWCFEVIITLFETKELVNRGFLNLPILPIYGFGALLISVIFPDDDYNWISIAIIGGGLATLLELLTSYIFEFFLNINLWNYDSIKYNFQGRISLLTSIFFTIAAIIVIKIINPIVEKKLRRYKYNIKFEIILSLLCVITFVDFLITIASYL